MMVLFAVSTAFWMLTITLKVIFNDRNGIEQIFLCEILFAYHYIVLYSLYDKFGYSGPKKIVAAKPEDYFKCEILVPESDEKAEIKVIGVEATLPPCSNETTLAQSCSIYI